MACTGQTLDIRTKFVRFVNNKTNNKVQQKRGCVSHTTYWGWLSMHLHLHRMYKRDAINLSI